MSDSLRRRRLLAVSVLFAVPSLGSAQIWTGAGTNNSLNTSANWNPAAIPGTSAAVTFPNLTNVNQRYSAAFVGPFTFASMSFTSTNAYSFSSASTLTLGNGVPDTTSLNVTGSGGVTFNNPVTYNTNTTFAATGSNITLAGTVTFPSNLTLTLNAAANRTVTFTGGFTQNTNAVLILNGNGRVVLNNSSFTVFGGARVEVRAGTLVAQEGSLVSNPSISGTGTLRLESAERLSGAVSVDGGTIDMQANQSASSLTISSGQVTAPTLTPLLALFSSGLRVDPSPFTPSIGVQLATPMITGEFGNRSSGIDLVIDGPLVATTTSYTSTNNSGMGIRYGVNSFGSTTLRARLLDSVSWYLNGGRPVGPGGQVEVSKTLDLYADAVARTLNANVVVNTNGLFRISGNFPVTVTSISTANLSTTNFNVATTVTTLNNAGILNIFAPSTITTTNNSGSVIVNQTASGTLLTHFTNAASGALFLSGSASVNGTIANFGGLAPGSALTHINGGYVHKPGASLDLVFGGAGRLSVTGNSASVGFRFEGDFTLGAGQTLEALSVTPFTNAATFTLAGGLIRLNNTNSNAPYVNLGTLTGNGTVDAINSNTLTFFNNDGLIRPQGNLEFINSMVLFNRLGTIEVTTGNRLGLESGSSQMTNASLVTLAGGTIGFPNSFFTNQSAGFTSGFGRIASRLNNFGLLRVTGGQVLAVDGQVFNGGTLRVEDGLLQLNSTSLFDNSGIFHVSSTGFVAGNSTLVNTGRIQGSGQINMEILNNPGGRIEPQGTLILGRELISAGSSQINLKAGTELVLQQGFSGDAVSGLLALTGGALDTNGQTVTNASNGSITGWGNLNTGGLRNSGNMTLSGGTSLISGPVANDAGRTLRVQSAVAIFTGPVTNNGSLVVTNGDAIFTGGFSGGAPLGSPLSATPNALLGGGNTTLNTGGFLESDGITQSGLTVSAGATVLVSTREPDGIAVDGRFAPASTSVLDTLSIAKDPGTGKYTAFVNLTTNDLVVRSPNRAAQLIELAAVRDMVRGWYTGSSGLPGMVGLGTTAAFYGPDDAFVTLSVFDNDPNGDGVGELATFNGLAILPTDTIVKYTYLGDTNIDGVVDATDLARVLAGLQGQGTGWNFGDVDHDGVVTMFDLGRTMAALRGQGAPLGFVAGGGGGGVGAIPEPAALGLLLAATLPLRRRR